jgi:hypothetical protein
MADVEPCAKQIAPPGPGEERAPFSTNKAAETPVQSFTGLPVLAHVVPDSNEPSAASLLTVLLLKNTNVLLLIGLRKIVTVVNGSPLSNLTPRMKLLLHWIVPVLATLANRNCESLRAFKSDDVFAGVLVEITYDTVNLV